MKPAAIILLVALLSSRSGASVTDPADRSDNESLWIEAAAAYDRAEYQTAADIYNRIAERGFTSAELYYNLGNANFKAGRLGSAIWAYRRALKLNPDLRQAKSNLEYVRAFNIDKIEGRAGGFVLDIWEFLSGLSTSSGYLVVFTVVWWIIGLVAILMIIRPDIIPGAHYLLIVCIVVAIFSGAAAASRVKADRMTSWGVIKAPAADIREGPGSDFQRIEIGHEGLEFKILGERENDYLIELENGLKGWIEKEAVLAI